MENHLYSLYQMVLKSLIFYLGIDQEKKKAGRPPKVSDLQRCALFILLKKRNLYSEHYKEKVRFEEMYYGVLVMVVCDSEGVVYDLWFHPASYHEVRSLRIRYRKSK
ncbi:MAG: hypothetical protein ACO2PP_05615, partial [Thermocrinis sp.]